MNCLLDDTASSINNDLARMHPVVQLISPSIGINATTTTQNRFSGKGLCDVVMIDLVHVLAGLCRSAYCYTCFLCFPPCLQAMCAQRTLRLLSFRMRGAAQNQSGKMIGHPHPRRRLNLRRLGPPPPAPWGPEGSWRGWGLWARMHG